MRFFYVLINMDIRKDYEKFTPTPNAVQKVETPDDELSHSKNLSDFDKQILVWGRAHLDPPQPSELLFFKVMDRIDKEEKIIKIRRRVVVFAVSVAVSAAALVPAWQQVYLGFIESGFFHFFSLLFSDAAIVMIYWRSFLLSLLEALPVMSLIVFSAVVLVFLESLKSLIKDLKIILSTKELMSD